MKTKTMTEKLRIQIGKHTLSGQKVNGKWTFLCPSWPDLGVKFVGVEDASACIAEFQNRAVPKAVKVERELLAISERCEFGTATKMDYAALLEHSEALSEMLADCWLALDELARTDWKDAGGLVEAMVTQKLGAGLLLRRQQAPGWKN